MPVRAAATTPPPSPGFDRRRGTIGVTVRLTPPRYNRLRDVSTTLGLTHQSILTQALESRMVVLERRAHNHKLVPGQISLFEDMIETIPEREIERRNEGTIGVGYRASDTMHRWLHAEAGRRNISIQDLITLALQRLGAPS